MNDKDRYSDFFKEKCMCFSIRIVKLYNYLRDKKKETTISKQLLRCGTSIGANYAEALNGISEADFLAKCYIALKEANESQYWIELLYRTEYLTEKEAKTVKEMFHKNN